MTQADKRLPTGIHRQAPTPEGFIPLDAQWEEMGIAAAFEAQVAARGDRIAAVDAEGSYTYRELNEQANQLAHALHSLGEPTSGVGLMATYGIRQVIGMLAALKAGMYFVPIDDFNPDARSAHLVEDSRVKFLITDDRNLEWTQSVAGEQHQIVNTERLDAGLETGNLKLAINPDWPSNLLYTSGTTGKPKAATHTHRSLFSGVLNLTRTNHFYSGDCITVLSPLAYGGSLVSIFGMLLNGGRMAIRSSGQASLDDLPAWLYEQGVTILKAPTPAMRQVLQVLESQRAQFPAFPDIRLGMMGGDLVRADDVAKFISAFAPHAVLRTGGGTSEALWTAECYLDEYSDFGDYPVPFGYIVGEKEVMIRDEEGRDLPDGEEGEIVVLSRYNAQGYWHRPEATAEKFLPDPDGGPATIYRTGDLGQFLPGGLLLHLGRIDSQVKVRGNRVELGEVENALTQQPEIRNAAVAGRRDHTGEMRLIGYVVLESGEAITRYELGERLRKTLPSFMIPARFVFIDDLPLTPNTKIDRQRLPDPGRERPDLIRPYAEPRTALETRLAEIWAEELELDRVGIDDEFFELGGHSLLATQLVTQISAALGIMVSFETLFEAPTVATMAAAIEKLAESGDRHIRDAIDALPRSGHQMKQSDSGELAEE